jgi:hypothetical protein
MMLPQQDSQMQGKTESPNKTTSAVPSISLPKGGGTIRGIGEKFAANPVTGTGSMTVPIAVSPGRSGFGPQLSLSYDSGAGNGPFGLGWNLSLPAITRKTDKGLPKYQDAEESDVFILSGAEDLASYWSKQAGSGSTSHYRQPVAFCFSCIRVQILICQVMENLFIAKPQCNQTGRNISVERRLS